MRFAALKIRGTQQVGLPRRENLVRPPEIRIVNDTQELTREAADLFLWLGQRAVADTGFFRVALSGGSGQLDWSRVEFYFGDDRCVPHDHGESNFGLANEHLFRPLKIAQDKVFRMEGEAASPDAAAAGYEAALRKQFGVDAPAWPRFDLILLGLGEDGHTASLFPGTSALGEETRLVVTSTSPKGIPTRLTFTAPLINQAKVVVFLVAGSGKASPVRGILEPAGSAVHFPGGLIRPTAGRLIWILDQAAASELAVTKQQLQSHEE